MSKCKHRGKWKPTGKRGGRGDLRWVGQVRVCTECGGKMYSRIYPWMLSHIFSLARPIADWDPEVDGK